MDFHNHSLNRYESQQRHQEFLKLIEPTASPCYYMEAFFDGKLEWTEYVYTDYELQNLKDDAISCGFTFTVQEVVED